MKRATLIICLLLICTIFLTLFASCKENDYEYEDFKYIICKSDYSTWIQITDLTEQGKQKEVLIVPATIDGIKVAALEKPHWSLFGDTSTIWHSSKIQKLFLPNNINVSNGTFDGLSKLKEAFIILENETNPIYAQHVFWGISVYIYVPTNYYNMHKELTSHNDFSMIKPANINYYYNYKNSENNGVYWIDNVEQGERIIDIPPTKPTRKGWTFGGWYTEPECINKWEFTNTVPENGVDLYAKWL